MLSVRFKCIITLCKKVTVEIYNKMCQIKKSHVLLSLHFIHLDLYLSIVKVFLVPYSD